MGQKERDSNRVPPKVAQKWGAKSFALYSGLIRGKAPRDDWGVPAAFPVDLGPLWGPFWA